MPPQRRKSGPVGPPRRRPKIAGSTRPRSVHPDPVHPDPAPADREVAGTPPVTAPPVTAPPVTAPAVTAPAAETPEGVPPAAPDRRSSGWRPVVVVGAVAVVLAAIAVVAAFRPGAEVSNQAWVDTAATREVTEAAQYAIETMHGYDYETIDEDFASIRELLTPERLAEFDATAEVTKQAAIQTSTVTEVNVLHIGTSMLDGSRAEVAAYINVSATGDGIAQGSAQAPLLVRMEKSGGRWLVSEIRDR